MRLVDLTPLKEQENPEEIKVKIDILGDEKEVAIKTTHDPFVNTKDIKDVTISWNEPWGEEVHTVNFKFKEEIEDHDNEGKDEEWIAQASFGDKSSLIWEFKLEVYHLQSQQLEPNWDTLKIEKEEKKGGDVEEGTCGYSIDGEGGDEPAGPHLLNKSNLQEIRLLKIRAGIIK